MEVDVLTIFPQMFAPLEHSMVGRARERGLLTVRLWDIREYADDRHRTVDDEPYGGGGGMVMKPEPIFRAYEAARAASSVPIDAVILMTPQGRTFTQEIAGELAAKKRLLLICGHYEGIDARVEEALVTDEISIGDYVLTGGELPAMVVIDAVARLIPGVLGCAHSAAADSFATGLLEHPHYTRPRAFRGMEVPPVLLSGDHEQVRRWRRKEALRRTLKRRPDLLERARLTDEDRLLLEEICNEASQ